jgi:UDP-N-acetylmuramyl pentapeptide phosphotransferase/UDP-N-acetylglucosamine-1-phosphate transferase
MAALASGEGLAGALVLAVLTAAAAWVVTRWVLAYLKRRAVLDHPNERSSHSAPTPRGGGIGILAVALPLVAAVFWLHTPEATAFRVVLALTAALALVSWVDDLRGIPVALRLAAHVAAVAVTLALMPEKLLVFQGVLPLVFDRIAAALAWVWFINLYNFMDGIDGIAGVETIAIGLGLFVLLVTAGGDTGQPGFALALAALVTASAAAGFLVLNWHPARVFMGDVGAIALGYLLGWFLLTLAAWGYWSAALILPGYYLADATITIARRALAGEPVWQAHAKHFYQRAVQRGLGHARVARFVAAGNAFLALIALLSAQVVGTTGQVLCLAAAAVTVGWMLLWLARAAPEEVSKQS